MSEMTPENAQKLREKFPPSAVGLLPKPYKKDSPRAQCHECGKYHGLPAVHLDYVGHAATTDRLLQVDPCWTWEPLGVDPQGLPAIDREGNLWIKLTVCGVTRLGVGDGPSMKERIGDAIRNAAMRFGVALDLWSKEELDGGQPEPPRPDPMIGARDAVLVAAKIKNPDLHEDNVTAWIRALIEHRKTPQTPDAYYELAEAIKGMTEEPAQPEAVQS